MKKSNSQYNLSIIIPAYREERRIGGTLDRLSYFLKHDDLMKNLRIEVIVVSANSPDLTHQIVEKKAELFSDFRLLKPGDKVGKGRDVKYGMLRANGEAVIFMDADLATPLYHLSEFYNVWKQGYDMVIATRNLRKHHPGVVRRSVSNVGNILFRIAGGVWLEDSQCGFKLFSKKSARICFSRLTILSWGFDMEILAIAKIHGQKMKNIRVNDWESVPNGTVEASIVSASMSSLRDLLILSRNRLKGVYKG